MTNFHGWLHHDGIGPAESLPARRGGSARSQILLDLAPFGLACDGPAAAARADDGLASFISGAPNWRDGDLAAIAAREGHAAALHAGWGRVGSKVLQQLGGSFALAVFDRPRRRVALAIDRFGIETLCYSVTPIGLVFGRSVDLVAAYPEVDTAIDPQSIYDYLYFHAIPSPQTIYAGVRKLEPGQCLEFADRQMHITNYWQFEFAANCPESEGDLAAELLARLEDSVRRLRGPSRTGAFLSGGIDSSTIAGLLTRIDAAPVPTFTIGFTAEGYDEVSYAHITSRHFKTQQHEYYLTPEDVVSAVPRIAAHYDEPFGNSSAVPAFYCARLAREHGAVRMLAGDGGDELFGGNSRYAKQNVFEWYYRCPQWLRSHLLEPALLAKGDDQGWLPLRKVRSYVRQAKVPLPDRLQSYNYFSRTPAREILHPDLLRSVALKRPIEQLRAVYERAPGGNAVDRMLFLDWKFTLADNDLRKVSQMCELAGVEVRYPWLDEQVVDLSIRLPGNWKVRGRQLRWFVKRALSDLLPPEVIHKPKHGFGLPFGVWMRTHAQLKQLAHDSLATLRRRDLVRPDYLDELEKRHRDEHAPYFGEFIWVLMMLEQWLENRDAQSAAVEPRRRAARDQ
jgi:asparagine synthase (glutamine-hydrolysing)